MDSPARPRWYSSRRAALLATLLAVLFVPGCLEVATEGQRPQVTIDAPADGALVSNPSLDVRGSVATDALLASVTVVNATTGASTFCSLSGSTFVCSDVLLASGINTLVATGTDDQGRTGRDAVAVEYVSGDSANLVITSPASAGTSSTSSVDVAGATSGFGPGLVIRADNGSSQNDCTVGSGTFLCEDVPLTSSDTLIVVSGSDTAGRSASDAIFVEYDGDVDDAQPPSVTITSPANDTTVAESYAVVTADVLDDSLIHSVTAVVDGVDVSCGYDGQTAECTVFLLEPSQTIEVRAVDQGGLEGSDTIVLNFDPPSSAFNIDIEPFDHEYTPSQLAAFDRAVAVWESLVVGDLEQVTVSFDPGDPEQYNDFACGQGEPEFTGTIDDLRVYVTSDQLQEGVLGVATPCLTRSDGDDAGTNLVGFMEFNIDSIDKLESDGQLVETIVHELGHVLGFGTNWEFDPYFDLINYEPASTRCSDVERFSVPPEYVGSFGRLAYERLGVSGDVPVEGDGEAGTRCGHWDEATFGNELMTGFLNEGTTNPLSELTAAAMLDLGLEVDLSASEPYVLPTGPSLRTEGVKLAGREILLRPIGSVDPATGRIEHMRDPEEPWWRLSAP